MQQFILPTYPLWLQQFGYATHPPAVILFHISLQQFAPDTHPQNLQQFHIGTHPPYAKVRKSQPPFPPDFDRKSRKMAKNGSYNGKKW
jgi:hypothetical protein